MLKKIGLVVGILILVMAVIDLLVSAQEKEPEEISAELKARIEQLIKDLGAEDWQVREASTKALEEIGEPAEPFLKEALQNPDSEVRLRSKLVMHNIWLKKPGKIAFTLIKD